MGREPGYRYRLSKQETSAAADVSVALVEWNPGQGHLLIQALPRVCELLQAEFTGTYATTRVASGWGLDYGDGHLRRGATDGEVDAVRSQLEQVVSAMPSNYPFAVGVPVHCNRVLSCRENVSCEAWESTPITKTVIPALGFGKDCYDVRVLIADRGMILGWCGAYQPGPFTRSQKAMFQAIVPTLRSQAMLERKIGLADLHQQAFVVALEAIAMPAYLVNRAAQVLVANEPGRQALQRRHREKELELCDWVRAAEKVCLAGRSLEQPQAIVTPIQAKGMPGHYLVVERPSPYNAEKGIAAVTRRWGLTVRQVEVLRWVVNGEANKEIAIRLTCSVRTVEHHLSAILAKAGLTNRTELVVAVTGG